MNLESLITIALVPLFGAIAGAFAAMWHKLGKKDETILELSRDNIALAAVAKQDAREDVAQLMKAVDVMKDATEGIQNMAQTREDIIAIRKLLEGPPA